MTDLKLTALVARRAADLIRARVTYYSCTALATALAQFGRGQVLPTELNLMTAYEDFVKAKHGGELPWWWNGQNFWYYQQDRINALEAFAKHLENGYETLQNSGSSSVNEAGT